MINNTPTYANRYEYIVARIVDNELWFYGAYHTETEAINVAMMVDGMWFTNEER